MTGTPWKDGQYDGAEFLIRFVLADGKTVERTRIFGGIGNGTVTAGKNTFELSLAGTIRGWTGKGSIIGIVDSGIDLDHSEFDGKIIDALCFTRSCDLGYESVDDITRVSHGTHIAGIAAASLDGVGTTGVAPDAKLLIAKATIGTHGSIDFGAIAKGVAWAAKDKW